MRKTVSGLCPETNSQQMITVTVERIQLGGGLPPSDKVIAYACSHAQEYGCSRNGADGRHARCSMVLVTDHFGAKLETLGRPQKLGPPPLTSRLGRFSHTYNPHRYHQI